MLCAFAVIALYAWDIAIAYSYPYCNGYFYNGSSCKYMLHSSAESINFKCFFL